LGGISSYKSIFKATSLFGGMQVIQIFLNLVRGKIIALLLGPAGVGLNSLFVSSVTMISNITGLGLNFTAVRDIAKANESGDRERLSAVIVTFKRWLAGSAIIGVIAVVLLSPLLSVYTFKNYDYTFSFIALSFMLLFGALSSGNASLLQGTRNLKGYALHSLTGSLSALVVSVPLYFFYGTKGIVPALIISALITFLFSIYYASAIKRERVKVSWSESWSGGKDMVKLGVAMMLATSIGSLVHYLINTYISNSASVADLGLYQAGMSITSQSIGLVFSAMAIDYYPRLSAISDDNIKVKEMVNQQGEITMLIATPVLILLSVAAPLIIRLLYSSDFLPVTGFLRILAIGMMFKAASYSIGAISFAKGDKKVFFFLEGIYMNSSILIFSVVGYKINGLVGLAWAYLIMHFLYFIIINIVAGKFYKFSIAPALRKILIISFGLMILAFLSISALSVTYSLIASGFVTLISIVYSITQIDKLVGIRDFINKVLRRS
jgi:O-antigen/teichoic acid export membrane protein